MKKVFILFLLILCGGVIVYGNLHWKSMTSNADGKSDTAAKKEDPKPVTDENSDSVEGDEKELAAMGNWPKDARALYKEKLESGETFNVVLLGSTEMDSIENGWNDLVTSALEEEYGDTISVESLSYDLNTLDFVREEKYEEVGELQPGLVIFEPFVFQDNGNVLIEDTLQNIETIREEVKTLSPGASFVLTPPQPIYQPANYEAQVTEIKEFAGDNGIPYIDHWSNWPDVEDEEIKSYLDEVSSPNEKGHEAWAKGIIEFLIKK